jgi:nucleoside 2-deoxyribosyltransferase
MDKEPMLYLAGGLFNAAERLHNLMLERELIKLGHRVILPQREALKFQRPDKSFDIPRIVQDCRSWCLNPTVLCIANADGPDADSGTCVEYATAVTATRRAVVYRTDFRTALDRELGLNAMLRSEGTSLVYEPCFFVEMDEVDAYYRGLAAKIHAAILEAA